MRAEDSRARSPAQRDEAHAVFDRASAGRVSSSRMAKKGSAGKKTTSGYGEDLDAIETALTKRAAGRPSSLLDTRVIYCGDDWTKGLEQLAKLPDRCVDLIYIDPPFNSNADYNVLFAEKDGTQAHAQITAFEDTRE